MHTSTAPTVMAEIMRDPTEVMKITITETRTKPPRVSLSEKVRPKTVRGGSEGRKRYRNDQAARRERRRKRETGWVTRERAKERATTAV